MHSRVIMLYTALGSKNGLETGWCVANWPDPLTIGVLVYSHLTHIGAVHFPEDRGHLNPARYGSAIDDVQQVSECFGNHYHILVGESRL
jgi:hypothetical protein